MKTGMIAILIAIGLVSGMRLDAQTWTQQTNNTTNNLWGVSFIDNNTGWVCGYGGTILKTTDGGNTWNNISLNISNARSGGFWFFDANNGFFAVGDANFANSKILRTTNGGNSWDTVYSGGTGWISFMDFPDRNNGYVTVSGGTIYRTADGGAHWNSLGVGGDLWMSGVYFFNKDTGLVSGGDYNTGASYIYKTTNGGNNWQTLTTAYGASVMLFTSSNNGYAIGFASGSNLITTVKKIIIKTTDGGANWAQCTTTKESLNGICFPSANIGYAVGDSGTILKYTGTTGVSDHPTSLPLDFGLSQNYPNPFNPATTISFSLPSKSFVSLKIFDLLGREVASIVSEEMSAGTFSRQWNAAKMSSGIYFYRLQAGLFTETKRLLLLK